jgi:hypothetical protein
MLLAATPLALWASPDCSNGPSHKRCEANAPERPSDDTPPSVLLYGYCPERTLGCLISQPPADRSCPAVGSGRRPRMCGVHLKGRWIPTATVPGHDDGPMTLIDALNPISAQQHDPDHANDGQRVAASLEPCRGAGTRDPEKSGGDGADEAAVHGAKRRCHDEEQEARHREDQHPPDLAGTHENDGIAFGRHDRHPCPSSSVLPLGASTDQGAILSPDELHRGASPRRRPTSA